MQKKLMQLRSVAYFILPPLIIFGLLGIVPSVIASPDEVPVANIGVTIKIITPGIKARLCPKPLCKEDQELLRISSNSQTKVEEVVRERLPMWDVVWYKITYNGENGNYRFSLNS